MDMCLESQCKPLAATPELWAAISGPLDAFYGKAPADATPQVTLHENVIAREGKFPILETYLETRTTWSTPINEEEVANQSNEDWDVNAGQKRMRRLSCLVLGLMIITVIMLVL